MSCVPCGVRSPLKSKRRCTMGRLEMAWLSDEDLARFKDVRLINSLQLQREIL